MQYFKLPKFFLDTETYIGKETGDVKSYKGKESDNKGKIATTIIANISLIKSYTWVF